MKFAARAISARDSSLPTAMPPIEMAYAERDLNLAWNFQDPSFDPLRKTPRFVPLRKKLGI